MLPERSCNFRLTELSSSSSSLSFIHIIHVYYSGFFLLLFFFFFCSDITDFTFSYDSYFHLFFYLIFKNLCKKLSSNKKSISKRKKENLAFLSLEFISLLLFSIVVVVFVAVTLLIKFIQFSSKILRIDHRFPIFTEFDLEFDHINQYIGNALPLDF